MIKIIAILDYSVEAGGGFNQALNAIMQMQRLSINRFYFEVFATIKSNIIRLNQLDIQATLVKITIFDRLLARFSENILWQSLQLRFQLIGPLEKRLIGGKCDLVYFVTPGNLSASLQKLNYIATVWDLCHRENPEFPETRNFNTFYIREKGCRSNFGSAIVTVTDSQQLADMASQYYGIDRNRFLTMPFSPSQYLQRRHATRAEDILVKYNLNHGYFFYPAQFWAHKNHIRILEALLLLRNLHNWEPHLVFSGNDNGNLKHISKFIKSHKFGAQVRILGFVPPEDMRGLYTNSTAVIMPTYFGPTNLPPLEAWSLSVPLIYSKDVGNAALLIDPDKAIDLAKAMRLCTESEIRDHLINSGHRKLADIAYQQLTAEEQLCALLERFAVRRSCWE